MTTKNPFPGMNPFFEQRWQDAHTRLITYVCEALQERLPADLVAGAEEELVAIGANAEPAKFRPDINVKKPWENADGSGVAVAAPVLAPQASLPRRFFNDDEIERWVEIHDETGQLVTVVELLSPSNKIDQSARERYRNKRRTLISAGVNVVEIDLVREGGSVFPKEAGRYMEDHGIPYGVCVFRDTHRKESEFYAIGLRDRLPVISIPLRPTDADIPLDLQPLIDQCHERGRYHRLRYRSELDPPPSPTDAAWVAEILLQHELL